MNYKQIAKAKTNTYFKFSKIFREQLFTFSSNDIYNEFQESCNKKYIFIELSIHNLLPK